MALISGRFRPAYAFAGVLLAVSLATRIALLCRADVALDLSVARLAHVFGVGLAFDIVAAAYFTLPMVLYLALLPQRIARSRLHGWIFSIVFLAFVYLLMVVAVAEWVFWDEFGARFNFIAVDYLIYTHEVLGNIWQSYPVALWLGALSVPALLAWLPLSRRLYGWLAAPSPLRERWSAAAALLTLPALAIALVHADQKALSDSDAANELAGNGIYEFFAANINNELSYPRFYATVPGDRAMSTARELVGGRDAHWIGSGVDGMHREVFNPAPDKRLNVVLVSIESFGAEFLGAFGNPEGLTPNIDALATESLSFTQVYATGNRTVRGMEALALSLPPTPGQSIVKRPGNEQMFTLGSVFEDRGYQTTFLYGGYGYFDNLNYFFGNNDYRVIDRTALKRDEITHETIWGVADEDLFALALRQLDLQAAPARKGKPFFMHILTTSNHRPYTYPAGRIDIASGSGRSGAVKYTDYAVGKFLREARSHPWFADTLFIITADHGASARGTAHIPLLKYRIPLLMYSPGHLKPGRFERLMSQIDIAPTLLGLLEMGYSSKFYGHDVFRTPPSNDRALVANYQTLGYMKDGLLVTLQPKQKVTISALPAELGLPPHVEAEERQGRLRDEAISLYQSASVIYRAGLGKDEERNKFPPRRP